MNEDGELTMDEKRLIAGTITEALTPEDQFGVAIAMLARLDADELKTDGGERMTELARRCIDCARDLSGPDPIACIACGGSGVISYNPNLNPSSFQGVATAKCTRCGGTGMEDEDEPSGPVQPGDSGDGIRNVS